MKDVFKHALKSEGKGIALSWHKNSQDLMWLDNGPMLGQAKEWAGFERKGIMNCFGHNNKTVKLGEHTFYTLMITSGISGVDFNMDPFALLMCGQQIDGSVYFFRNKVNRDRIFAYLDKRMPVYKCDECEKRLDGHKGYCSGCKSKRYCGDECQKKHWKESHKGNCAAEKKERKVKVKAAGGKGKFKQLRREYHTKNR